MQERVHPRERTPHPVQHVSAEWNELADAPPEEEVEKTEEELAAILDLTSRAQVFNWAKGKFEEPSFRVLPHRCPRRLPPGDDRCDGCSNLVSYSPLKRGTGARSDGEFQGSYEDHSWAQNVEPALQEEAYELGLIDRRWYCTQYCGCNMAGGRTLPCPEED